MSKVRVLNPFDNTDIFGVIPPLTLISKHKGTITTVEAPIHLVEGRHIGPNSGFGVEHIWAEHSKEIISAGYAERRLVSAYVQRILASPAVIYFEDRQVARPRVNTVRIVTGTVILEYVRTVIEGIERPHWSVVTAYSNPRTAGVLVGGI